MTPDVNVMLAAAREDHVHHRVALGWLVGQFDAAESGSPLVLLPPVVAGFLRIATNRRVFAEPMPTEAAVEFVDSLLAVPGVELRECGREWPALRRLVVERRLAGNDVPDAWIAACVQGLGEHLVTFDADFSRLLGRGELTILRP